MTYVKVRCDCGKVDEVRLCLLKKGMSDKCVMCSNHGDDYKSTEPWYKVWSGIIQRCTNKRSTGYKNYGGRGIKVCNEWKSSSGFKQWIDNTDYEKGLQIDRIDNDGNYEPNNCRWVTPKENSLNKRSTLIVRINGKDIPLFTLCKDNSVKYESVLSTRRLKKISIEDAFMMELGRKIITNTTRL